MPRAATQRARMAPLLLCAGTFALAALLLGMSPPGASAVSHGHDHVKLPSIESIKQHMVKQGSLSRGDDLHREAAERHKEMHDHVHSTHAHEHKYGQLNRKLSPLPPPKPPKPYEVKDLAAAHTFSIRRSFNMIDKNKDGVLSREELETNLEKNHREISVDALRELLKRKERADLNPPKYMYVPRKNFKDGQNALIAAQMNNMKKARKRMADFIVKNPNRSEWTPKMIQGFDRVNQGIEQQSHVLNMDAALQDLIDRGEGDSSEADILRKNITKRNMHLHPYENHKVTEEHPHKARRVERAKIFHEHSPERKKDDGGHDLVEMLPINDQNSDNAEALTKKAKEDLAGVIKRKQELFNMQDVNRDGQIDFKEYYWRLKRQKVRSHEELKEEQRKMLAEPRKQGFFTEHGFWIPPNEKEDDSAKKEREAQEKEREAILSSWEEEL